MQILDSASTMKRLLNDGEFVCEMYSTFLENFESRIERIVALIDGDEFEALWKEAHGLKGASSTINAEMLQHCIFEVEQAGRAGDVQALRLLRPRLIDVAHRTAVALQEWIALQA